MLGENINALIDQRLGAASASLPGSNEFCPDDLDFEIGLITLRADHEGVDSLHNFRHRHGNDKPAIPFSTIWQ